MKSYAVFLDPAHRNRHHGCEAENRSGPGSAAQARLKPVAIADFGSDPDVDDAVKLKKLFFDLTHISGHAGRVPLGGKAQKRLFALADTMADSYPTRNQAAEASPRMGEPPHSFTAFDRA